MKFILKNEADGGYGDLGVIPSAPNPGVKSKECECDDGSYSEECCRQNEFRGDRDPKDKKLAIKIAKARSKVKCGKNMSPHRVPGKTIKFVCKPKDKQLAKKISKVKKKFMKTTRGKKSQKISQDTKNYRYKK